MRLTKIVKWLQIRRKAAMERRKWDPKTKAMIVLEGLRGKPVAEICIEHQISQTQYYRWRDHFLSNMNQVFRSDDRKEMALTRENARLKRIIGDLTIELKKTEEWLR
jgi:transposase-like protein